MFVVSGLSKIAGLPQMKAAWIVAEGAGGEQALERLEVIADTFLSMNAPVQCALPAWLDGGRRSRGRSRNAWQPTWPNWTGNFTCSEVQRLEVEGGWYAVLRIPALEPDERTVLAVAGTRGLGSSGILFRNAGIGLAGGSLLGPEAEFADRSNCAG